MALSGAPRALSLPPGGEGGNPFWSERARGEHHLALLRPGNLPNGDDSFGGEPLEDVVRGPRPLRRSRSPGSDPIHQGEKKPKGNEDSRVSEGNDKFENTNRGKGVGNVGMGDRPAEGSVERELEKEMVKQLSVENEKLREQLRQLQSGTAVPPPPPPPRTPEKTPPMMTPMSPSRRYTPNGTEVPSGPPPGIEPSWKDQIPRWPESLGGYEIYEGSWPAARRDERTWRPRPPGLHEGDGVCPDSRAWHGAVLGGQGEGSWVYHGDRALHGSLHGELREGDRALHGSLHGGHREGARAVHFERDGERERWEELQRERDLVASTNAKEVDELLRRSRVQRQEDLHGRVGDQEWMGYLSDQQLEWLLREGALQGQDGMGSSRLKGKDEAKQFQEVLKKFTKEATGHWPSEYWGRPFQITEDGMGPAKFDRTTLEQVLNPPKEAARPPKEAETPIKAAGKEAAEDWRGGQEQWHSPVPIADHQEEMRSIPIVLPTLADPTARHAALMAGDWLTQIEPLISDVSARAGYWWNKLLDATMQRYREWLQASPLKRLYVDPPGESELPRGFDRLRQRVTSLLLAAIPTQIKEELISTRQLSPQGILFKVLKVYQPGGLHERSETLTTLTRTTSSATAKEAVEALRLWKRHHNRAIELGASLPDATLMIRSLDKTMEAILAKDAQANFRVNTFRMQNEVDVNPSDAVVNKLYEMLLAEAEMMVSGGREEEPVVKQMQVRPNGKGEPQQVSPGKTLVCKWWGSTNGCNRGKSCKFLHDPEALDNKSTRCWACSSTTHTKKECPTREGQQQVGGSGSASNSNSTSNKGQPGQGQPPGDKKGWKGGGKKGKDGKNANGKSSGEDKKEKEKDPEKEKEKPPEPNISSMNFDDGRSEVSSVKTASTRGESLINEVTSLLRSMRISTEEEPSVKAMIKQVVYSNGAEGRVLVDGGATHCLRRATHDEWHQSSEVTVHLATGSVKLRQHPAKKTIFTREACQPIIPVSLLVQSGAQVSWDKDGCEIYHPAHGKLNVKMDQGCPTLEKAVGLRIMEEIEQMMERGVFAVRMLGSVERTIEDEEKLKKLKEVRGEFPLVPDEILSRIPGSSQYDAERLPLNRKMRRRVKRAEKVIVHLFSGPDPKEWMKLRDENTYVICIDKLCHNGDLLCDHLMGWLEELMDSGKTVMLLMGPPCRTVSAARHMGDGGPRPLRSREGRERFGLENIMKIEKKLAEDDAVLMLRAQWLARKAKRANPGMESLLEQPRDPAEYRRDATEKDFPSFLVWPETQETMRILEWDKVVLDQGAIGHQVKKPSTLLTDIPEVKQLHGLVDNRPTAARADQLEKRIEQSKSWAAWADGLKWVLKVAARRLKETPSANLKMVNVPKKEVESWRRHFAAGHIPYRKDCGICVEAAGRGRPRRKISHPEAYCLSLDLAGPFTTGIDQSNHRYDCHAKYFMIGTVTIPTKRGRPMVEGLDQLIARDPGRDAQWDKMEDVMMSIYEQYKDMDPEQDPLKLLDEDEVPNPAPEQEQLDDSMQEVDVEGQPLSEGVPQDLEKAIIEEIKDWTTEMLTVAVPVGSRHGKAVLEALSWIYSRFRSLHIPIKRVHSDRAREFTSKEVKKWIQERDLNHTFTEGDSGEANGRAEREIGILKALTRAQLTASGESKEMWPLALRHASELRHRHQLRRLGVDTPMLIPFGTIGYARRKRWDRGEKGEAGLLAPMKKVKIMGPAATMSLTSKGYYCRVQDTGNFIFSTAVLVPKPKSKEAFQQIQDEAQDRPAEGFEAVRERVEAQQDRGLQWLDDRLEELEAEGREVHHEQQGQSPDGDREQAQQQIEQLHDREEVVEVASDSGEPEEELFVHGFEADLAEEYDRLFPADGSEPLPVRRRLWGKQTVPARLQVLNLAGGECAGGTASKDDFECYGCGLLQRGQGHRCRQEHGADEEACLRRCKFCEEVQEDESEEEEGDDRWSELKIQQHWAISSLVNEEITLIDGSQRDHQVWIKMLTTLQEERDKLEEEIKAEKGKEEEVLQGRTVSNQEVRMNFEEWREPIQKELDTLLGNGALVPIDKEKRDQMIREHESTMECIPAKIVAVIKAGGRRKARLVACGNYAITDHITQEEKTASGADIVSLRTMVRLAAHRGWSCSSLDIKGAFLLAPRRKKSLTVLTPPKILKDRGMIPEGLLWQVNKAFYGLVESPADWGSYRDEELPLMRWEVDEVTYRLKMTGETNVWKILQEGDESENPQGYLATYVDDMLMVGPEPLLHGLMDVIGQKWECSSKEFAEEGKDLRFCGMEIRKTQKGFDLHQSSYILDLLNRREIVKKSDFPMGKVEDLDEDENKKIDAQKLREAQQLSGELIWIATRTRMDVAYAVGAMSRRLHKDPEGALKIGQQVLEYLNQFPTLGLSYTPCEVTELDQSQVPREVDTIEIFADVSFAPGSESYRSVHGIVTTLGGQVIQWHTGRQSLIATSTAEGELLSYQEAQVMGAGVEELLYEMGFNPTVVMYGDNKAAISLATLETGSWRTRHLRIRAGKLRQTLRVGTAPTRGPWQLRHMSGTELVADGLTKALGRQAFLEFVRRTKMSEGGELPYLQINKIELKESDLLHCYLEDKVYYKQMVALAVAGLLLILLGEHHLAAVLLMLIKTSMMVQEKMGRPIFSGKKEEKVKEGLEEEVIQERALRVNREPRRELEELSYNVLNLIDHCPRGQDKWLPIQPGRWLMRAHGKHRQRLFHPLHRGCPVDSTKLEPTRFTVIYHGERLSKRIILRDEWDATPIPMDYGEWKGYTIFKVKEDEEPAERPQHGYGGRDPRTSTATLRSQAAMPKQSGEPLCPQQGIQKVTPELQQIGRGEPQQVEVLQAPLPPRPRVLQDPRGSEGPERARGSADLPDAVLPRGSGHLQGPDLPQQGRSRGRIPLHVDPEDFVDSLNVSTDFVPVQEDDDGFELVSSQSGSSTPPRLRAMRVNGQEEVPQDEADEESSTSGTSSSWTSASSSSAVTELDVDVEMIDPPEGQRGVWDDYVQPKATAAPTGLMRTFQEAPVRGKSAPPVALPKQGTQVFNVFPSVAAPKVGAVPVMNVVVYPKPRSCVLCKAKSPGPAR